MAQAVFYILATSLHRVGFRIVGGGRGWRLIGAQLAQDGAHLVGFHALLLRAQPLALVRAGDRRRCSAQVFTQVIEVDQIIRLCPKPLLDLLNYPRRAIAHTVQLGTFPTTDSDHAVDEQLSGYLRTTERRGIPTTDLVRRAHQAQARFSPTQLPPLAPISRRVGTICPRANTYNRHEAPVQLTNQLLHASRWQPLQHHLLLLDRSCLLLGDRLRRADRHLDAVMFFHLLRHFPQRHVRPKIGDRSLQAQRITATTDPRRSAKRSPLPSIPFIDLFAYLDLPEPRVPVDVFFTLRATPVRPSLSLWTLRCLRSAQPCSALRPNCRNSWITCSSASSALTISPSAFSTIASMASNRARNSGYSRNRSSKVRSSPTPAPLFSSMCSILLRAAFIP